MFVTIGAGSNPSLEDANEFHALKVVWTSQAPPEERDIAPIGRLAGEYVWLDPTWLRQQSLVHGPEWEKSFNVMVEFAHSKGWTDAVGSLRAHIVKAPLEPGA